MGWRLGLELGPVTLRRVFGVANISIFQSCEPSDEVHLLEQPLREEGPLLHTARGQYPSRPPNLVATLDISFSPV